MPLAEKRHTQSTHLHSFQTITHTHSQFAFNWPKMRELLLLFGIIEAILYTGRINFFPSPKQQRQSTDKSSVQQSNSSTIKFLNSYYYYFFQAAQLITISREQHFFQFFRHYGHSLRHLCMSTVMPND